MKLKGLVPVLLLFGGEDECGSTLGASSGLIDVEVLWDVAHRTERLAVNIAANSTARQGGSVVWIVVEEAPDFA